MIGANQSNNIFKYNNKRFTIFINLFTGTQEGDLNVSLDMASIEEFVYESELNELCLHGHIIYTDKYAQVDKFLNQHFGYCNVDFYENKQKNDGGFAVEQMDEKYRFIHNFIISGVNVISRTQSIIKYDIELVSCNWFQCAANIDYSNYDRAPESIFSIMKSCIASSNLIADKDTFGRVETTVTIPYATQANDNLFSVVKYLMHKLYYYQTKDTSLKFFLYNETDNQYQLFNVTDKNTATGLYNTIFSFFKTSNETMIQQEPTNIGYFDDPYPKTKVYSTLFEYDMYKYSREYNTISNIKVEPGTTVNYLNNKYDADDYEPKYKEMFKTALSYRNEGSYWNNDQALYSDSVRALQENNALVLNITGEILRKPGSLLNITLDRSMKNATNEVKSELEKLKKKYKAYEGTWMTSKVQHIIRPNEQSYRQQVMLFRNYIPKIDTESQAQS